MLAAVDSSLGTGEGGTHMSNRKRILAESPQKRGKGKAVLQSLASKLSSHITADLPTRQMWQDPQRDPLSPAAVLNLPTSDTAQIKA